MPKQLRKRKGGGGGGVVAAAAEGDFADRIRALKEDAASMRGRDASVIVKECEALQAEIHRQLCVLKLRIQMHSRKATLCTSTVDSCAEPFLHV